MSLAPCGPEGGLQLKRALLYWQQLYCDTKGICDWLVITFINLVQMPAACSDSGMGMAHKRKWHTDK